MTGRRQGMSNKTRFMALPVALLGAVLVTGCSGGLPSLPKVGDLNPFKEKTEPLPGKRVAILPTSAKIPGELASGDQPIALSSAEENSDWSQPGGIASNAPGHLALGSAVHKAWNSDAGVGSGKSGRLTASPIVLGDRVYTLDAGERSRRFQPAAERVLGNNRWCQKKNAVVEVSSRWAAIRPVADMAEGWLRTVVGFMRQRVLEMSLLLIPKVARSCGNGRWVSPFVPRQRLLETAFLSSLSMAVSIACPDWMALNCGRFADCHSRLVWS